MNAFENMTWYIFNIYSEKRDIVKELPVEISNVIFSLLDERSLKCAAEVSRTWRNVAAYERKRRQPRDIKRKIMRKLPVGPREEINVTFIINERNGNPVLQNKIPSRFLRYSCTSDNPEYRKGMLPNSYRNCIRI